MTRVSKRVRLLSSVIDPARGFSQQDEKFAGTAFGRPPQLAQTTCGFFFIAVRFQAFCAASAGGLDRWTRTSANVGTWECGNVAAAANAALIDGQGEELLVVSR